MNKYMELLEKPFLKNKEIAVLLDVSASTVTKITKEKSLTKHTCGYSTDEIIEKLDLKKYIKRHKNTVSTPTKATNSAIKQES